jgi:hypothetical protein
MVGDVRVTACIGSHSGVEEAFYSLSMHWALTGKNTRPAFLKKWTTSRKSPIVASEHAVWLFALVRVVRRFAAESMNVLLIFGSTNVSKSLK